MTLINQYGRTLRMEEHVRKKLGLLFLSLGVYSFTMNSINVEAKGATNELNEIFDYKKFLNSDYAKLNGNYYQGKTFRVSKVACYLEVNVEESYEEKEWWWNWWKIDNTISKNYSVEYYIADLITFVYNDNTFGNTEIGTYDIKTIKNY